MKVICTLTPTTLTKLLLFAFLTALAQPATATIRYVTTSGTGAGTSWSDAGSDLQAMINASSNGDTVWVANGGYNSIAASFIMKEGVKIYGGFTGTETSLSQRAPITQYACALYGNSGPPVFSGWLSAASLLDGFTLNCIYNNNSAATYSNCFIIANWSGGGMQNYQSSRPVLYNCQFRSNFDKGIAIYDNSVVTCHNCDFAYNYYCAIWMREGSAFLYNCTFSNNQGQGGAIGFDGGGVYAENCTFNNNNGELGGAIYGYSGSITVFNCTLNNNMCPADGGGAIGAEMATTTVINSTISGNTGLAGAIYSKLSECYINNCLINGNIGTNSAIYTDHFLTSYSIINSTISGNFGGPAINGTVRLPTLYNTIVYNNTRGIEGGTATCYNSLVQGYTDITNGNISGATDPMFIDMQKTTDYDFPNTAGNFRLQPCSPLINKGNNAAPTGWPNPGTDLAGNIRIYNNTIDIGAYEQQGPANGIFYVKAGATGPGNSWSCPMGDLQQAINLAVSGNQVWVTGGTYLPNRRADVTGTISPGDRNNAFLLKSGVKIYGGFAGTETSLSDRNLSLTTNTSILSGDLNSDDNGFTNNSENAYHVVVSAGAVDTAELNGFTIQGGNSNGSVAVTINSQSAGTNAGGGINCQNSSPTLKNLIVKSNAGRYGAGLALRGSSSNITNCTITANAGYYGGGVIGSNCGASFTNVLISGNTAVEQGGGMYNEFSVAPTLTNVTITSNTANYNSGAMYNNLGPAIQIRNSIIYGNNTGIYNNNGTPNIQYSLVQGETSTANSNISGATNPLFTSAVTAGLNAGGNYTLQTGSPAINAGNNTYFNTGQPPDLSAVTTDLNNTLRIQSTVIDIGAYEQAGVLPLTLLGFTGTRYNEYNQLKWTTADEVNTSHFMLERSTNGSSYSSIATITAAGTGSNGYSYKDYTTFSGKLFYRLKMVDMDGRYTYSPIVTLTNNGSSSVSLYPNPASDVVHINAGSALLNTSAGLYDANGRLLQNIIITSGLQAVNIQHLLKGLYIVKFSNGVAIKFVKE